MHHCTYLQKGGWVGINWRRISQDTTVNGEEGSHDKLDFLLAIDYWLAIECTISMENVKVYFRKWKWDEHEIEMFSSQWKKYKDRFSLKSAQKSTDAQNFIFTCKMSPEWRLSGSQKYNRSKDTVWNTINLKTRDVPSYMNVLTVSMCLQAEWKMVERNRWWRVVRYWLGDMIG